MYDSAPSVFQAPEIPNPPDSMTRADALELEITDLCAKINAASYRLLQLVAELDDEEPWGAWGLARVVHRFPTADAAKRTVTSCTPDGPLNVIPTTPSLTSGPCNSPQRLCDALAT